MAGSLSLHQVMQEVLRPTVSCIMRFFETVMRLPLISKSRGQGRGILFPLTSHHASRWC